MQTPEVHALTGAYVLDALNADERTGFEVHLDGCHACTTDVAELTEAVARLGTVATRPVPAWVRASVLAQVARTRQLPPLVPRVVEIRPRRRRVMLAAAAAVLAAVAGAGIPVDQHHEVVATRQANADLMTVLAQPDARTTHGQVAGGGEATVVASRRADAAVVVLRGLPDLPAGRTYELWLMDARSKARPAGLMSADQTRLVRGLGNSVQVGLTVEAAGGAARPTPPVIAALDVA
jgi:Anti-sigma-K factor rskA/Putative zinc-finger